MLADNLEIKLYKKPIKAVRLLALTIPLVVIGIWLILKQDGTAKDRFMGWLATLFFGLGLPLGLFHLFDRRPQIIINEHSLWDRMTRLGEIRWEQIKSAYPVTISRQKFISLVVDDTFAFKKKQYRWAMELNKALGAQRLNLSLGQLNIDEQKLVSFINKMCKAELVERQHLIRKFLAYPGKK